jgi:hypothetical protein
LSYSDAGLGTWVLDSPVDGREGDFDQAEAGASDNPELVTDTASDTGPDDAETAQTGFGSAPDDARARVEPGAKRSAPIGAPLKHCGADDPAGNLDIPPFLDRRPQPRQDGRWVGTYLSDDDDAFIASGKFK